jgi:endoglucanase
MMKKITLLLALLITSIGFSQTYDLLESFNITGYEDAFGDASAEYAADPIDASTQVVKITSTNGSGQIWQGINVVLTSNYTLTSATQLSMQLDVYSNTAITIAPKAQGGESGAPDSVTSADHGGEGWETLTFTFDKSLDGKVPANGNYGDFALHINWNTAADTFGTPDGRIFYIKNLKGLSDAPPAVEAPTDAPSTPATYAANNIISLYSEAFTPSATISNVGWDDSLFEEVTIAGNKVLKITGANFIGIDLDTYLDASNMTHLHMDYWLAVDWVEGQVMNPKLSNHPGEAGEVNALDISNPIDSQSEIKNWQSKDFALNGDRGAIKQFLITQAGRTDLYYLDNVYMYVAGTASVSDNELLSITMYPNPTSSKLNISAPNTIKSAAIYNILGKQVMRLNINKNSDSIDVSNLCSGMYLIKYTIGNAVGTAKFIKQ